ncbi:MAG: hypothetical protein ACR2ND_15040 [Solirubrobacteraceae bacterium]
MRCQLARAGSAAAIAAWTIAVGLAATPAASATDSLYWANPSANKISFASLDGSVGGNLTTTGASLSSPEGVALDPAAGRLYWANAFANKISFANLDGSGGGDLATGAATVNEPIGVAVDPAGGRIYWANALSNKISFTRLDGSGGGGDLATGGASVGQPEGVSVDPAAGRIYWANAGAARISFANLNGSGGGDLATGAARVDEPIGVAIDPLAGRIYWANAFANRISFANRDGSGGGGDLPTGSASLNEPEGVAIDPDAGRVYWASAFANKLSFARLDGSGGGGDLATAGATAQGPAFPALLHPPSPAGVPQISGAGVVGAALSCSPGTWAADLSSSFDYRAPQSYAYSWAENGAAISATSNSIIAGSPGSYTCRVTASNHAGSNQQISAALAISAGGPGGSTPGAQPGGSGAHFQSGGSPPTISALTLRPRSFRVGSGTRVTYTDSAAATTTFTALAPLRGFRRNGRCRAGRPAHAKHLRRCTRYRSLGSFTYADSAGRNHFHFTGRVRRRNLRPGAYRLQATPRFAGRTGAARSTPFRVVR